MMIVVCASAKPGIVSPLVAAAPLFASAPLISSPYVAAQSSQFVARNYNGIAAAPLIAAPSAYAAYSSSPLAAAAYPFAAPYTAAAAFSPYTAAYPFAAAAYSTLPYTAGPVLL